MGMEEIDGRSIQQETTRVVMEAEDRATLNTKCEVRRSNRLLAEGLKEGIGYMPMKRTWVCSEA